MKKILKIAGIGFLLGLLLYIVDLVFRIFDGKIDNFEVQEFYNVGYFIFYTLPLTLANYFFFNYLNNRVDWEKYNQNYRIIIGFIGSVVITIVVLFFLRLLQYVWIERESYSEFIENESFQFYFTTLLISLIISIAFHAFYFYKILQEKKVKEQKIIAGTASAKFESLKNQIDPHFLFNSLNVLTSLIEENSDNAQKFTTSLSKI